jgi:hypothetical protein
MPDQEEDKTDYEQERCKYAPVFIPNHRRVFIAISPTED